jgi:hypothetical protein
MNITHLLEPLLDKSMQEANAKQTPREYLGASRWGEECSRMLAYEYHKAPTDKADRFSGKILRVFDMGHDAENRVANYLIGAGFALQTTTPSGGQFGFKVAGGKLAGHCDGVITAGPLDLPYPIIWENKGLNDKSWKETAKKGVKESKPVYYGQLQTYMAYLDVPNGSLFTAINRNTGEIYAEFVEFNLQDAQELSDKAARIIRTESPEEMPRISENPAFFKCCFCDYQQKCHGLMTTPSIAQPSQELPAWITNRT